VPRGQECVGPYGVPFPHSTPTKLTLVVGYHANESRGPLLPILTKVPLARCLGQGCFHHGFRPSAVFEIGSA
jgi:hypothetical protein